MIDLAELATKHLDAARSDQHGRSAGIVAHDGELRQTVIALTAGSSLGEHNSPNAATLQVWQGRVRVESPEGDVEAGTGHLWVLTHERHSVHALEDSVFLLTTLTGVGRSSHG
ncbi:cupin [Cellulomonas sp. ICMP 17802]|uniref:cupin n=1 Tax=Cellulomonas sp. ICMP 17802 TaxID=3239199 RepID=UPI00351BDD5A